MHHSVKLWPGCINSVHAVRAFFFAFGGTRRQSLLLCLLHRRLLLRLRPLRDTDATNERSDMPFRGLTPPTLERWRTPMAKAERERVLVVKNLSLSPKAVASAEITGDSFSSPADATNLKQT